MCTRERTLRLQLTEEEEEEEGFSRTRVAERKTRNSTRERASLVARNRQFSHGFRCRRKRVSPPATRATGLFADQRAESELSACVQVIVEILESWWRRVAFTRFRYDDSLLCGSWRGEAI